MDSLAKPVIDTCSNLPKWVERNITADDMVFFHRELVREKPAQVIEIGTASGTSAAFTLLTLAEIDKSEPLSTGAPRTLISYDRCERVYFDSSKKVGDAVWEICPELAQNLQLRNPHTVVDFPKFHAKRSIDFLFLDANHAHPCPTLDLLLLLEFLADDALVVFHDINLGMLRPDISANGVDYLFANLTGDCWIAENEEPNIGSWRLSCDRSVLKKKLAEIVMDYKWDRCPPISYLLPSASAVSSLQYVPKFLASNILKLTANFSKRAH